MIFIYSIIYCTQDGLSTRSCVHVRLIIFTYQYLRPKIINKPPVSETKGLFAACQTRGSSEVTEIAHNTCAHAFHQLTLWIPPDKLHVNEHRFASYTVAVLGEVRRGNAINAYNNGEYIKSCERIHCACISIFHAINCTEK
jgi:hypothetical protein